jgi:hypothetical protein
VNTYDPMDGIVYRHLDARRPSPVPATRADGVHRLPSGYPNGSPRTYLRTIRSVRAAA